MPIWGIVNQKGGVGKTTTAVNFASVLAAKGKKTLIIDCDPQGNATTGVGIDKSQTKATLFDVIVDGVDGTENAEVLQNSLHQVSDNLWIIPSNIDLAGAESVLLNAVGKEQILAEAVQKLSADFDWILIDSPPSLGLLTVNILAASDGLIVPLQCEFYALEGLSQLLKTVDLVKRRINPRVSIELVLLTMYDPRNRLTQQVEEEVRGYFGEKVSSVVIPRNVRLSEAPSHGESAVVRYPSSKGAEAYVALADEVLAR